VKTFFKWFFWGIVGIIAAVWIYNTWQEKTEIDKQFGWILFAIFCGFWLVIKEIETIKFNQQSHAHNLKKLYDSLDQRTMQPRGQEMLYKFLLDQRMKTEFEDDKE
jgi:thiol:disulfide interchange protein